MKQNEIRKDALAGAASRLGISLPITVRRTSCAGALGGYHGVRNGRHLITLDTQEPDADVTLWHELVHAAQRERYASNDEWHLAFGAAGWLPEDNAFEIEAETVALRESPILALVN